MHRLLERQLKRLGLEAESAPPDDRAWQKFLRRIDRSYEEADQERYLMERSLSISSREMQELNENLRQSSETRIAAERDKLQAVISSVGDGLCTLDQDACLLSINPEGERLLGRKESELIGQSVLDLVEIWDEEQSANAISSTPLRDMVNSGQPYRNEDGHFRHKDGTTFPVSLVVNPIIKDNKFLGAVLVFRDITKEVQEDQRRRQRSALLQGVASAAEQLLTNPNAIAAINQTLATLGTATGVDRIHIFENHPRLETGELAMSQRFEWVKGRVEPQIEDQGLENLPYSPFWYDRLSVGETISHLTQELPSPIREEIEAQGILSLLAVPITIEDYFWGHIRFDDCHSERQWRENDQAVLMIAAGSIGGVIRRQQLERTIQRSLERRGRQIQISTLIAQRIAAAPTLDELFRRVVTLIKEQFGYYHTQIFRYELALNAVVMVAGYGEIGQQMLAASHSLELGHSVVGAVAATGRAVLISDVSQYPNWVPIPLLPDVKSELAVPIKLRDQMLAILAVQSDRVGGLTADSQILLEGLCGQIATAIESTRLRQEMEENLRELNAMYRAVSRKGWQDFREMAALPEGYRFDRTTIQPVSDLWMPEIEQAVAQEKLITSDEEDKAGVAVAPLSARGEVLGALGVHDDLQHPLSPEDLTLIEAVSEQVGLALEDARLFEQTHAALDQTEALYAGSDQVIRATTMDQVLQALIQSTALQRFDQVSLEIFDHPWEDERPEGMMVAASWERGGQRPRTSVGTRSELEQFPVTKWLRRDAPLIILDIAAEEQIDENTRAIFIKQLGLRSMIVLPLVVAEQWLGILVASSSKVLDIDENEIRQITSLTDQAATVIQTMRLVEQTQAALFETMALHQAGAELNAAQNYQDILNALRRYTVLGQADRLASIDLFDRPCIGDDMPDWIIVIARWPHLPDEQADRRYLTREYPSFFELIGPDEPMIVTETETDSRLGKNLRELFVQRFQARSVVAIPLMVGGQWLGYINGQYSEINYFSETEIRRLTTLTAQAAVAVHSLRQLEDIQARVQREQQLREITARMRTPPNVDGVMRVLAQGLGQVLGRRTAVRLKRQEFMNVAAAGQQATSPDAPTSRDAPPSGSHDGGRS